MSRRLPPLLALKAFEAAGRHLSFSLAADELHVTQGAISRQVRLLETFLGEMLFVRGPRGVALTECGQRYLRVASDAFDRIAEGISSRPSRRRHLSISILPSTASLWLQQRLSVFELQYQDIRLILSTSQRPVNFEQDGVDVAMRVGVLPRSSAHLDAALPPTDLDMASNWNGVEAICLWEEEVAPICSAGYLESIGGLRDVADLERATLIHNESRPGLWATWLAANNKSKIQGEHQLYLGQRYATISAAQEGRGIACVATKDVDMLPWQHTLRYPFDNPVRTGSAYYLLYRSDNLRLTEIRLFCDWLQQVMGTKHHNPQRCR